MTSRTLSRPQFTAAALALGIALTLSACGGSATPLAAPAASTAMSDKMAMSDKTAMPDKTGTPAAMANGAYVTYADYQSSMAMYQGSKVVLFFHASWCPDCRATDTALTGSAVPDGLTVVKVDYDTATELKQKYGITQQHTFVQVDPAGMSVKKWTGTKDGAAIKAQTT